jgi:predicted adenylyl cyclase CyaB
LKVADEHETKITDVESFSAVLEKYGLEKTREKKKHRISYSLDNVEFDIDDYENIPTLLEIESTSLDEINAWIKKLGLRENITKDFGSR